jgi:hypothetical protein
VPSSKDWRSLHTLRIGNNSFDSLGEAFYYMGSLTLVDAMNNK